MKISGPGQSTHLLIDVVASLNEFSIDYVVIGALAAAVHGVVDVGRGNTPPHVFVPDSDARQCRSSRN